MTAKASDDPRWHVVMATDRGLCRERNEDAVCALLLDDPEDPRRAVAVLAVADGMGGVAGGQVASVVTIGVVESALGLVARQDATGDGTTWAAHLKNTFDQAGTALRQRAAGEPGLARMGTTLTCVVVDGNRATFAHVGDSRAYLLRAGVLRPLTTDHNAAADLVKEGRLSAADAETHRSKHVLTRWLSADTAGVPDVGQICLDAGDVVLLCSDGLHGLVPDAAIAETLRGIAPPVASTLSAAAARLVAQANAAGGRDNVSVAIAAYVPGHGPGQEPHVAR